MSRVVAMPLLSWSAVSREYVRRRNAPLRGYLEVSAAIDAIHTYLPCLVNPVIAFLGPLIRLRVPGFIQTLFFEPFFPRSPISEPPQIYNSSALPCFNGAVVSNGRL
jgi:hypothetical protein